MSELTFYQITLLTDCLQTLISYLHNQHCAHVDEHSNHSVASMPYYILHRYNDAQHYAYVDVL